MVCHNSLFMCLNYVINFTRYKIFFLLASKLLHKNFKNTVTETEISIILLTASLHLCHA